jgi:hypothetical protein
MIQEAPIRGLPALLGSDSQHSAERNRATHPEGRELHRQAGIEEHFLSPANRASWATSASAGQDASESLNSSNLS